MMSLFAIMSPENGAIKLHGSVSFCIIDCISSYADCCLSSEINGLRDNSLIIL